MRVIRLISSMTALVNDEVEKPLPEPVRFIAITMLAAALLIAETTDVINSLLFASSVF